MSGRAEGRARLEDTKKDKFDLLIVGGGATGFGIAVDSATRGYRTVLIEVGDFAQATPSRATKLVHEVYGTWSAGSCIWCTRRCERKIMLEAPRAAEISANVGVRTTDGPRSLIRHFRSPAPR